MWSAALALGVLLLASACGGGGTGSKDAASSTTGVEPVRSKAVCLKLARAVGEATTEISQGLAGTIFAWDPLGDGEAVGFHGRDVVQDSRKFALVAAGAPGEVKAQFGTINETLTRLADALGDITIAGTAPPSASQLAQLQLFQSRTDRRRMARAQGRLTTWFATRCPYY